MFTPLSRSGVRSSSWSALIPELPVKKNKKESGDVDVELVDQSQSSVYVWNLQSVFFLWHSWDSSPISRKKILGILHSFIFQLWLIQSSQTLCIIWRKDTFFTVITKMCARQFQMAPLLVRHGPSSFCLLFVFVCFQMSVNNFYSWKSWCVLFLRCALK